MRGVGQAQLATRPRDLLGVAGQPGLERLRLERSDEAEPHRRGEDAAQGEEEEEALRRRDIGADRPQ